MRVVLPVLVALLLTGCASPTTQRVSVSKEQTATEAQKQLDIVAEELISETKRLREVHWRLSTKGVAMCPKVGPAWGAELATTPKGELAGSMVRLYGTSEVPTVLFLVPGSPAEAAGLRPGDRVLSIYGTPTSDTKALAEKRRTMKAQDPMPLVVRRGVEELKFEVKPVPACDYPAVLAPQQILNAFADGERIMITRGMMNFARTDEELALVVGHELAHNTMRHIDAKKANAAGGFVADLALAVLTRGAYNQANFAQAAASAYSQEFEAEADYVGLYMMAAAGYAIDDAPKFWRRMAAANPGNIKGTHSASHPSTSYRMVALEEAVKEIKVKAASGSALIPTKKDGTAFAGTSSAAPGAGGAAEVSMCVQKGRRVGDTFKVPGDGEYVVRRIQSTAGNCPSSMADNALVERVTR
ncbi:PDZ domain-containing protein [Ramlibacter henchirensis]|uniref:PDZ domain-containing protein n=1 Tax=Ramlibacter henchirensis TaxID=204072 RepID=A0A4Z0BIX1_9BURK|nr:M48 family metallopeptidase [Ramlibacter henchirensis]TFY99256.1 PDZ domain-containing protein [Ramlibacter henchirensis]